MADVSPDAHIGQEIARNLVVLEAELRRRDAYKIRRYFPDDGPLRRELYPKHVEFFAAGALYRERAMIAANRIGKTETGAYEGTNHLTGIYPHWWTGKRFASPIRAWACGTTVEKTKEIVQAKLIGPESARGTGMIPGHLIHHIQSKGGGAIESVWVKHVSGGVSELKFKSYESGRAAFEGTEQHLVWLDEEPPEDVYVECLLRTMATGDFEGGCILLTFTPLQGQSQVVLRFLPNGVVPENGIVLDDDGIAPR